MLASLGKFILLVFFRRITCKLHIWADLNNPISSHSLCTVIYLTCLLSLTLPCGKSGRLFSRWWCQHVVASVQLSSRREYRVNFLFGHHFDETIPIPGYIMQVVCVFNFYFLQWLTVWSSSRAAGPPKLELQCVSLLAG